jgi:hypothetical protein
VSAVIGAMIAPSLGTLSVAGFAQGTIGFALLQMGGSMLLSAAAKALMPQRDPGMMGRGLTVRQPVMPRDVVYGQVRKGGTLVYADENGWTNEYLDLVIVLATHKIKQIGGVYLDGQMVFAPGSTAAVGQYAGFVETEQRLGDANQPSLTVLTAQSGGKWTSAHRLRGCAHVWIRLKYDANVFPGGLPNITFDLAGKDDIYDPRTGLTGYSENAALCLADYMSNAVWGIGAGVGAPDGIDSAALIAAANVCDEVVAKVGGGTERRYACGGVITLSQTPKSIIEAMLTAMAGDCGSQAGQWQILAGAWRTPTITLTDDDIVDQGFELTTRVSQSDNFNAVRGKFVSPVNDWQPDDFPAYESAAYLAEDGGQRKYDDIDLPFTTSASAAQRLAKIKLERQRRQMTVALSGKLTAWRVTVGDTVMLTYARWGFAAKPFEVRQVSLAIASDGDAPRLVPSLVLRETSPLVYDWTASEGQIYAAAPRTNLPNAMNIPPPSAVQVAEQLYQTFVGTGLKVMARISWAASPSAFVSQYQIEARIGTAAWQLVGRTDQLTMDMLDIAPAVWEFRVKALSQLNVSSAWAGTVQEIFGLGAPPAALTGVTLQTAGGMVVLKWAPHPDLDVQIGGRIVIRHSIAASPSWTSSVGMDVVAGSQAIAVVPQKAGTYLLRAEDAGGIPGPEVAISSTGYQAAAFAAVTTLTEDSAFSGAKAGVAAVGGALQLDTSAPIDSWASFDAVVNFDQEGGILPTGTYSFATGMNLGSIKLVRLRSIIDVSALDLTNTVDARLGDIDTWATFDGAGGGDVDVVVEARLTTDDPAGSPTWGAWGRVDSTEVRARGVQARATLTSTDGSFTPSVTQLRLTAEEAV